MEIREDNNTIKLKKDVVKNIAIVFLAIMLILTFFSNSIMNKSLPEVATQYVQSGTITEKIRGTGIVEADDPYSVIVQETRKIESVAVKVGDEVEKDQPLFYLEDSDSTELEEAERALEDLILKYTAGALTGEMSDGAYKNATAGRVLGMNTYEAQIEAAKNRVKAAEDLIASLERQQIIVDNPLSNNSDAKLELEKVSNELTKAESEKIEAKSEWDEAKKSSSNVSSAEANVKSAKEERGRKQTDIINAFMNSAMSIDDATWLDFKTKTADKYADIIDRNDAKKIIEEKMFSYEGDERILNVEYSVYSDWLTYAIPDDLAKSSLSSAYADYINAKDKVVEADVTLTEEKNKANMISTLENDYKKASNKVDELTTKKEALEATISNDTNSAQGAKNDLALKLADANLELTKAKEAQSQLLTDISKTLDLTNQNSIIRDQQVKVAKLREKATGAVITSPVTGTILTVTKTAGESTAAAEALATIQVTGKPMTMNFAVTAEQAKKVKIGDQATLQNAWYYSDNTKITLTKIANDPNNPGRSKLLMFNVEGEVSNGESLSISLGQRSREFQLVVPNSAVREDNRGKFIYIIEEKGTPFGNRYKAKRIDVEVVASDDNNTAIEANMDAWVYVITTSNKPIESGQQVRLSDR